MFRLIRTFFLLFCFCGAVAAEAGTLSLDSCRNMALRNNKAMQIARERINAATYQRKQAKAAYLPALDFAGTYIYNQKELSLLAEDQMLPTKSFNPKTGSYDYNLVMKPDGAPLVVNGTPVPSQVAMIPKEAMTFDIHNVFAGAVTLTQPLFMGGKIRALNKLAELGEEIAVQMRDNAAREVVYEVDAAYWQVVSLGEKKRLADSYIALLDTLRRNVSAMVSEGVATKADMLTVEVKLNEARIDQTKVDNGLALSRMALAQICGLPIDSPMRLADEDETHRRFSADEQGDMKYDIGEVYSRRSDLRSLELAVKAGEQQQSAARAELMPTVALVGAYSFTNPNLFNGFEKNFNGMFSVGAMVKIPLWHWGGNYNKYKAARSATLVRQMELDDAREKVELQVSQAAFKASEAKKTLAATRANLGKAEENLRQARVGYKEGVMTIDHVMGAQTAWLKANSENIDADIDVQLCRVYLAKVTGSLDY